MEGRKEEGGWDTLHITVFMAGKDSEGGFTFLEFRMMTQCQLMVTRRLYAQETWIALGSLSIYLGLTEILPRRLARQRPEPESQ